ncbi:hypothetical protein G6L33_22890 [Agrobacterium rhizogenes]|nr:hypothetical protein [Rhizobium rhizogenes]NTH66709.1 hypothetical protein [Rhizobium rhizogenes]
MKNTRSDRDIETQLARTPSHGDVVILNNMAIHKSKRAIEILRMRHVNRTILKMPVLHLNQKNRICSIFID